MLLVKLKDYIVLVLKKQLSQQFNRNIFFIDTKAFAIVTATLPIAVLLIAIAMMAMFSATKDNKKSQSNEERPDPINPALPHSESIVKYSKNNIKNTPLNNKYSNQQKTIKNNIKDNLSNTKNNKQSIGCE